MEINQIQLDALREVGNIGSGHAATALSTMLNRRIDMSIPEVRAIEFDRAPAVIGNIEVPQAVIYVKVEGDAPGKAVFFFPLQSAEILVQALFGTNESFNLFENEMAQSAMKEVGNIMVSSFLVALTQFSGIPLQPSVPALAVDMVGAIFDAILLEDGVLEDTVLFINTQLSGLPQIEGKFVFLPDEGSLSKLLGAIGV
ncbi:chemotaxis protein CheC, inhibitor of MCP methylation [Desulfitobacterium dichloroeliminans LMG P-21439]|uniref:Chemotaxis protein CheC, inhibitor of MCP methylation n=1 Tax=Desulfitobacterium dichloroeliminans (strain LMG P-21439 / DCA1) TaxID=871963 RepID=L0FB63_DESDL|nr:chemotaxis protein CheC [Desulfitobacterium dichloroeliminans]AGA70265.1 chemotaxis protein CheC, inhibitor of MCP methylation [Desulfitobacterium dichloroeliminans LMG P-21439]